MHNPKRGWLFPLLAHKKLSQSRPLFGLLRENNQEGFSKHTKRFNQRHRFLWRAGLVPSKHRQSSGGFPPGADGRDLISERFRARGPRRSFVDDRAHGADGCKSDGRPDFCLGVCPKADDLVMTSHYTQQDPHVIVARTTYGAHMGVGQSCTRIWTAGCSPSFHLPGQAILVCVFLTHSRMNKHALIWVQK